MRMIKGTWIVSSDYLWAIQRTYMPAADKHPPRYGEGFLDLIKSELEEMYTKKEEVSMWQFIIAHYVFKIDK